MGSDSKVTFWCNASDFALNMGETVRKHNGKDIFSPKVVRFVDGVYTTGDKDEIAALRSCSIYGHKLFENDPSDEEAVAAAQEAFRKVGKKKSAKADQDQDALVGDFTPSKK